MLKNKIKLEYILIAILAILFLLACLIGNSYKNKYRNAVEKLGDTIEIYVNKNNELYKANTLYVENIKELKKTNQDLYNEVKSLEDNPIVITKTKIEYVLDSVVIRDTIFGDTVNNVYTANIDYSDKWTDFHGMCSMDLNSMMSEFVLDSLRFDCSLTMDIIEKGNNLYIIGKSDNPYLQINNLEGVILSPEKSKILKRTFNRPWGIMAGAGVCVSMYDGKLIALPGVQVTIGYKFLNF